MLSACALSSEGSRVTPALPNLHLRICRRLRGYAIQLRLLIAAVDAEIRTCANLVEDPCHLRDIDVVFKECCKGRRRGAPWDIKDYVSGYDVSADPQEVLKRRSSVAAIGNQIIAIVGYICRVCRSRWSAGRRCWY